MSMTPENKIQQIKELLSGFTSYPEINKSGFSVFDHQYLDFNFFEDLIRIIDHEEN